MRRSAIALALALWSGGLLSAQQAGTAVSEVDLTPEQLVAQLGDESYLRRERARLELVRRESEAQAAIEAGLKSADLEVRYHCEQLLVDIQDRSTERRLNEFVADAGSSKNYRDFPLWEKLSATVGDSTASRELYVEMYRAERETLKLAAAGSDELANHIANRGTRMQRNLPGYFTPPTLGGIAALLAAAGLTETTVSQNGNSMIYSLCHQPVIVEAMNHETQGPMMKKLMGKYLIGLDGVMGYQGMTLAMRYNLNDEGLALADKLLDAKDTNVHYRAYAVLAFAKLGNEKHLARLDKLMEDSTAIMNGRVNRATISVQIRDVAMFAKIHLCKQNPSDFGFKQVTPNPQFVANFQTLGFENDEQRAEATKKWKEYEAKAAAEKK